MPVRNDDFEKLDPGEYPERDWKDNGEAELSRCPECKLAVFTDSLRCPSCGYFLEEDKTSGKPIWVVFVAGFLLFWIVLFWVLGGWGIS